MNINKSYESNLINNALFKPLARLNNSIYNLLLPKTQELEDKDKIIHDLKIKIADNESHFIIKLEEKNKIIDELKIKIEDNKSHFILELEEKNKIIHNLTNENKDINYIYNDMLSINNNNINNIQIQLDEKNKNNETNKCTICLDNTISHCCAPCGHVYCYDCIDKTNYCYICRGIIHNTIKLYL